MQVTIPPVYRIDIKEEGNSVIQLAVPSTSFEGHAASYSKDRVKGIVVTPVAGGSAILVITNSTQVPPHFTHVIRLRTDDLDPASSDPVELTSGRWERHPNLVAVPDYIVDPTFRTAS